jgi:hypothetical protein
VKKDGPKLNVYYSFNEKWRLFGMYSATKIRTSDYTDGAAAIYLDYFAYSALRNKFSPQPRDSTRGYYLWLRAGYYYSSTPPKSANPVKEHTIATEYQIHVIHLQAIYCLTARNRFDWRTVNRDLKVQLQAQAYNRKGNANPIPVFTPYLYGEYFVNFNEPSSDRFRLCIGIEIKVALYVNFESY